MLKSCTTFEASSISRSTDISRGAKFKNGWRDPNYAPFRDDLYRQDGT